ncbi:MAG: short-chain dehydrogenase, partial [Armatimonadetes bacterium CG_4_10_14_3_um_filter_59_10]
MRLHDKVAIITGSGTGLGKGIAKRFAREGASVVICGRRIDKVQETVEEISGAGGTAIGVQADVADEASVKHLVAE